MRIIIGLDGDVDGYLVSKNAHLSYWTCTGKSQHKHFINLQRNEISMFDVKLYFFSAHKKLVTGPKMQLKTLVVIIQA